MIRVLKCSNHVTGFEIMAKDSFTLGGNRVCVIYIISDTTKFGNYAVQAKYETLGQDKLWLMLGGCRPTAKPENVPVNNAHTTNCSSL